MQVEASAPSNIALIKYMGKTATASNLPSNASFSYALDHLRSFVTLESIPEDADRWETLPRYPELHLSEFGQKKFLSHFQHLKRLWNIRDSYIVRSANNFPADCGLASSASSFAALTLAAWELAKVTSKPREVDLLTLSCLARLGSGSSCRSMFAPWALWRTEGAEPVDLDLRLAHAVVIVADEKKAVSSSEAHQRVMTSLLFRGRPERAESRLDHLLSALREGAWAAAHEICWNEFWDMHALFETSRPNFGYMNGESLKVLTTLRRIWTDTGDGPLVTMDAGANVHLLLRPDQTASADQWLAPWATLKSWK